MKKLTEREKILLTILFTGILMIVVILYWVLPTKNSLNLLENEKEALQIQKLDMETKIAQTNKLVENKEELIDDVNNLMSHMSDPLLGENFDLQAQAFANNHGMSVNALRYGDAQTISPSAQGTPTQQYEYNLKTLVDVYSNQNEEEVEIIETDHEVLKKTITLEVMGSYLNTQKLLRDLNNMGQTYYVKSVSYSRTEESTNNEDFDLKETKVEEKSSIEVEVYFLIPDRSTQDSYLAEKG